MEKVIYSKNKIKTLEAIINNINNLNVKDHITCVIFTKIIPFKIKNKINRHFIFCNGENLEKILGLESVYQFIIIENMRAFTEDAANTIQSFMSVPNNTIIRIME